MSLKITHKNSTVTGTPPAAGDIDVGEIAINAADAELYVKDNAGNIRKFQNTTTGTADGVQFTQAGIGAAQRTVKSKLQDTVALKDFKSGSGNINQELTNASSEANFRPVFLDSQESYSLSADISVRAEDFGSSNISGNYRIIDPYSTFASSYKTQSFSNVAPQPTYAANCPNASDISLRVFYARNPSAVAQVYRGDGTLTATTVAIDPTVSKTAITDFHATRIDWFYASATNTADSNYGGSVLGPGTAPPTGSSQNYSTIGKAFIDDVEQNYSIPITGAINTRTRSDTTDFSSYERNGSFYGDPFNPDFINQNVSWAEGAISAGCSAVIVDDVAALNKNRMQIKYLDELRNNIVTQQSLVPSISNCGWAKDIAPSAIAFECGSFEALNTTYDWHSLEIQGQRTGIKHLHSSEFMYEITNLDGGLEGFKKRFAMAYANGQIMQVPHDTYLFNSQYRLYATANEFANYTAFVSASASDLNGYEGVCISGIYAENEYRWQQNPIKVTSNPNNLALAVVARAKSGDPKTVIHVINESYTGSSLSGTVAIQIKRTALGGSSYSVNAYKPGPPGTTSGRTSVTFSTSITASELEITIEEPNPWVTITVTSA